MQPTVDADPHTRTDVRSKTFHGVFMLAVVAYSAATVQAQLIPTDRMIDWKAGVNVGVPGGIPMDRTHLIDVTKAPYNADNTGAQDAQPAIAQAIKDAKAGDVVFLPAGTYRTDKTIDFGPKKNITLRGEAKMTIIEPRIGADDHRKGYINPRAAKAISLGYEGDWQWNSPNLDITGNPQKGSTILTVEDTSALDSFPDGGIGKLCRISLENDPKLPVVAPAGGKRLRKQMSRVVAKTATTVEIFPPICFDLPSDLTPKLAVGTDQAEFVGLEDLVIDCTKAIYCTVNVWMPECYGCWLKNVTSLNTTHYHICPSGSLQCEIRGCDIRQRKGTGPNGGGVVFEGVCSSLVEDNIIYWVFPQIEINNGSTGNVIAYNFVERNDVGDMMGCAINCNHGPHNSFNLYEGNIASVFQGDGYHGSGSNDTIFRNWFHATSDFTDQYGVCINLNRFSRNYNIVGNLLGREGHTYRYDNNASPFPYSDRFIFVFGMPNMGNGGFTGTVQPSQGKLWADWGKSPGPPGFQEYDQDVRATTILKGNWNAADHKVPDSESLGSQKLPDSLYLSGKPAWFGDLTWPPFDPAKPNLSYEAIPAGYRYVHSSESSNTKP